MTSANTASSLPIVDSLTVHVYSAGGGADRVHVHLKEGDLASAGVQIGDEVVLEIQGAVVRGVISKDRGGVWLGTQLLGKEWSHQRITDALRAVGITNPSTETASIVTRNGESVPVSDPDLLRRRVAAINSAGVVDDPPTGNRVPAKVKRSVIDYQRSPTVVAAVCRFADGQCELCEQPAPFVRDDGTPFLEVHHVKTLADGGCDEIDNAAALCPNCHRRMHYAAEGERRSAVERLRATVARLSVSDD